MKTKQLTESGDTLHALVFETGEEVVAGPQDFARRQNVRAPTER